MGLETTAAHVTYLTQDNSKGKHVHLLVIPMA